MSSDKPWQMLTDHWPPYCMRLETRRDGEAGTNVCLAVYTPEDALSCDPSYIEWVEVRTGVTTVTHGTFLPPTHWRLP